MFHACWHEPIVDPYVQHLFSYIIFFQLLRVLFQRVWHGLTLLVSLHNTSFWYVCSCGSSQPWSPGLPGRGEQTRRENLLSKGFFFPSKVHRWILGLSMHVPLRRTFEGRDPGSPSAPAHPSRVVQTFERRRVRGTADVPTVAGRGWTHRMVLQHQPIRSWHTCVDPLRPSASKRHPRKESHVRSHPIGSAS